MLTPVDIKEKLKVVRNKRIAEVDILKEVVIIFDKNSEERLEITKNLLKKNSGTVNTFKFDTLKSNNIFHINDIEKLCIDYRLRFLDSRYFKGNYPDEAISEIRKLEKDHDTTIKNCKVVAPAKLMKLENADDPMLFAPMGNNYYYLIHKWGNDLHPLRKLQMWPYKSFENLLAYIFVISMLLTALMPISLFSNAPAAQEYFMLFLFMFKGVAGVVLFYGFAKGKNFNSAIWRSKYYNA